MTDEEQSVREVNLNPKVWALSFLTCGIAISVMFALVMPGFLENAYS